MILELTRKQEEGLKIAVQRYKAGEPWTCIAIKSFDTPFGQNQPILFK